MRKRNGCGPRRAGPSSRCSCTTRSRWFLACLAVALSFGVLGPLAVERGGQDDLFRQTYLRSLQAAGRHADAAAYSARITAGKLRTPLDHALAS